MVRSASLKLINYFLGQEMNMFSEKLSAEDYRKKNDEIQHLEAVIDWLESNAADSCTENYYTSENNLENTLHNIKMGKTTVDLNPDCTGTVLNLPLGCSSRIDRNWVDFTPATRKTGNSQGFACFGPPRAPKNE